MHICIENQITTFDHADIYGNYTTEADFGKAFVQSKIDRKKIQLISKCGIHLDGRNNNLKHYDYAKATHLNNLFANFSMNFQQTK